MSKNGFLVFDSDMHIMEPPDLWQKYIDEKYKVHAPIGLTSENVRDLRVTWPEDGDKATPGGINRLGHNYELNQKLYKTDSERGWVSQVQIEAMDTEGIDVAVMFPSRGLSVLTRPTMDTEFAAAIARAYNAWMSDEITLQEAGSDSIGVMAGDKRGMKMRFKFESQKLAASLKMSGDPW